MHDNGEWAKVVYNSVLVTPGGGKPIVGPLGGVSPQAAQAQRKLNTGNGPAPSTTINRGMPDPVKFANGVLRRGN